MLYFMASLSAYEIFGRDLRAMHAEDERVIADLVRRGLVVPSEGGRWRETQGQPVEKMPDGNTAALDQKERKDLTDDIAYERRAAYAEKQVRNLLAVVDSDVVRAAFASIADDEWRELAEDLGDGPFRDFAHAGLVLREVLERHLFAEAMEETDA